MTNETTIPDEHAIYASPAILCRVYRVPEGARVETATIENEDGRALVVFRNEEEAEDWRRLYGRFPAEEGFKPYPADDDALRMFIDMHECTHVVLLNSWLGEDSADFYDAEDVMGLFEESVPA
jgi:hypothetical protein